MLQELRVENLLLIDRAELRLAPGLNVVTGETGAGKTLLAQSLDLLLGAARPAPAAESCAPARPRRTSRACSRCPRSWPARSVLPTGAEEIVLARRVWPDGRTRAYVCGRSATVADLRELGSALLAFYGQHEHRKLMLSTVQLDVLDAHCGPDQLPLRESGWRGARAGAGARGAEAALRELAAGRERELDLLAFELEEIESVAPTEDEEASELRGRARSAPPPRDAAGRGGRRRRGDLARRRGRGRGRAARPRRRAARGRPRAIDPELAALSERAHGARSRGTGAERARCGRTRSSSRRRRAGSRRSRSASALFARLERKHGGGIAGVLAHAERCRARREELERAEIALVGGRGRARARPAPTLDRLAAELSGRRRRGGAGARRRGPRAAGRAGDGRRAVRGRGRGRATDGCGPRGADDASSS